MTQSAISLPCCRTNPCDVLLKTAASEVVRLDAHGATGSCEAAKPIIHAMTRPGGRECRQSWVEVQGIWCVEYSFGAQCAINAGGQRVQRALGSDSDTADANVEPQNGSSHACRAFIIGQESSCIGRCTAVERIQQFSIRVMSQPSKRANSEAVTGRTCPISMFAPLEACRNSFFSRSDQLDDAELPPP
jgi:hypothetical protein